MIEVWGHHQVVGSYPPGTEAHEEAGGRLRVGGQQLADGSWEGGDTFERGQWSAVGVGYPCAFLEPDPDCIVCNPPEEETN